MFELLNLSSLVINLLLFSYFSIVSVMPVSREEKLGEKAWKQCYWFRMVSNAAIVIVVVNVFLWIWIPIPKLSWYLNDNPFIGIFVGFIIVIPCSIILYKAIKDGGREHMKPLKDTTLHGGIYKIIRHPGVLGEMPWYIALGFFLNSIFLIFIMTTFVIIYTPIYIYFEDKDLLKRFGDDYKEYKQKTGALIPKYKK